MSEPVSSSQSTFIYLLQTIAWMVFMAALLFWPAGTFAYPGAWALLIIFFVGSIVFIVWLSRHSPGLLKKRMSSPIQSDQESWDKIFLVLFIVFFCLWLAFMAWDAARMGFTAVPLWLQGVGAICVILEFAGCAWTFNANAFAAPVVEIQAGQRVIDTGPYAFVRHPMYTSSLFLFLGTPLLLGSWSGLWISFALCLSLAWRAVHEEETLRNQFADYEAYSERVKYRLVPGIW